MKELSKRRIEKLARKEADKKVRAIYIEYESTWRSWKDSYQDLDEPLRRGFKRNLVLKPSAYRRSDFEVLESLIPFIDTCHTSNTREFKSYDRKTGNLSKEFVHRPKALGLKDYDKLSERQKAYFDAIWITSKWGTKGWYEYRFAHENLLISKMSKWFVTSVPILDPDNDSRRAELHNIMYGSKYLMRRVDKVYSNSNSYRYYRDEYDVLVHRKLIQVELKEARETFDALGLDDVTEDEILNFYRSVDDEYALDEEYWFEFGFFKQHCTIEGA